MISFEQLFDIRYLYVGGTSRKAKPGCARRKIGIAKSPKLRWKDIDKSVKVSREYLKYYERTPFAKANEQLILRWTKRWKAKMPGSGRSEWRDIPLIYLPLLKLTLYVMCWMSWVVFITMCVGSFWIFSIFLIWVFQ